MSRPEEDDNAANGPAEALAKRKRATRLLRGVALVALVLLLLPHGIRWGMTTWLDENGAVESRIENVDFNPFTGHLAIAGLTVRGAEEERLVCKRFEVNFDWLPLANKRLEVVRLKVQGLDVDIRRRGDGRWVLGGIALPPQEKKEEKGEWHWGLGSASLSRLALDLHTEEIDERFIVDQLHLANLYSWEGVDATPFRLQLSAFGGDMVMKGHGRPFATPISIDADLRIEGMALNTLEPLVERPIGGELDVDLAVQAEKGASDGPLQFQTSGEIDVADFLIAVGDLRLSGASLDWTGAFRFSAGEERPWALEGDLVAETVALDDPGQGLNMARIDGLEAEGAQVLPDDVIIDSALLSSLEAFERPQVEEQAPALEKVTHLLEADKLELGAMRFNDEVMRFERAILTGAEIHMVRRPGMGMELSAWLEEDQQAPK
ncbi:MAG: DUF748 domain-containing protein, partial [Desulfuromonadales bacterium]|nr:DUF748 domain-containing protein [Desulfuromonadales bacterium]NIS43219.1 DUF748 domain-containing protein [Desulfuromonadales bacterium]